MSQSIAPFDKRAILAVETAQANSEFTLSQAQKEQALQPLVTELLSMPTAEAWAYIKASFSGRGPESIAVMMFKDQSATHASLVKEVLQDLEKKPPIHIDDWIMSAAMSAVKEIRYAGFFFHMHRLPAVMESAWHEFVPNLKLFCTYEGVRYRVTGA